MANLPSLQNYNKIGNNRTGSRLSDRDSSEMTKEEEIIKGSIPNNMYDHDSHQTYHLSQSNS